MNYEDLDEDTIARCLREEYETKVRRLRENSWFFAFVGVVMIPALWAIIESMIKNPKVAAVGVALPLAYLLIRQLIVWIGMRRIKTHFATRMMIS